MTIQEAIHKLYHGGQVITHPDLKGHFWKDREDNLYLSVPGGILDEQEFTISDVMRTDWEAIPPYVAKERLRAAT